MKVFLNERIFIYGEDWISDDGQEILNNLDRLIASLNCFNFHTEASVHYGGSELSRLLTNFNALDSLHDYALTNPIDRFRLILNEIEAIDWEQQCLHTNGHLYQYVSDGVTQLHCINGTSVAEAAEYRYTGEEVGLLNLFSSKFNDENPTCVLRKDVNARIEPVLLKLPSFVTKANTADFVVSKRVERKYNLNPKHGENRKAQIFSNGEIVSPLECSEKEAADLLPKAVGFRKKASELYAYDEARGKFMVFKRENTPNNSYHSYHPTNQNEVDQEVKTFLME